MPSRSTSPLKNTLTWFVYGCCVSADSVLWLIIVLFIFSVTAILVSCLVLIVTRWAYVRTIRNKADQLRKQYDDERKKRRELDYHIREIAMRPIHAHHYHQGGRHRPDGRSPLPGTTAVQIPVDIAQPYYQTPPQQHRFPTSTPKEGYPDMLYTGHTPLTSGAGAPDAPGAPPTDVSTTATTSPAPAACSTTPAPEVTEIFMKPRDIAATTHAIASSGVPLPQDKPVPHPGVLLRNADNTGHGQCPSDKVCSIPSNETMTSPTAGLTPPTGVAQVVTTEKLTKTSSSKTESKKTPTKDEAPTTLSAPKTEQPSSIAQKRGREPGEKDAQTPEGTKRKRTSPRRREQVAVPVVENPTSSAQTSHSFFPYWTGQRKVFSRTEPPPNGSSKGPTIREISSETNIWIPSTADAQGARSTPAKSESTSKRSSLPPDATREPPLDVYELRRRQERAQMTEIAMRQLPPLMEQQEAPVVQQQSPASPHKPRYSPVAITSASPLKSSPTDAPYVGTDPGCRPTSTL
ncbi:hypothetical protein Q1695_014455 [Nippostrongylus brasiliensis]|nr:hypothetical protein Q1695_014455 [Nippostrongylus brasiliensis]